jgi:hypothetical protein
VPRKLIGTLTSSDTNSMNSRNFTYFCISNVQRLFLNARTSPSIENYIRVIVFAPNLQRASFYSKTGLLLHSTTIKLVLRSKLINDPYPILRVSRQYSEVFISLVAAVFMPRREAGRYLQSKRPKAETTPRISRCLI